MTEAAEDVRDELENRAINASETLCVRADIYERANKDHYEKDDEDNPTDPPRGEELSRAKAALECVEKVIDQLGKATTVTEAEAEVIDTVLREVEADIEDLPADEELEEVEDVLP